jgi:hypothetical protein
MFVLSTIFGMMVLMYFVQGMKPAARGQYSKAHQRWQWKFRFVREISW